MKLSNGSEVTARRYQEQDAEAIVNLIRRNFLEVNVKDYGEKAMKALAGHHDVNWFKGVASYANVYVFAYRFLPPFLQHDMFVWFWQTISKLLLTKTISGIIFAWRLRCRNLFYCSL